MYDIIASIVTFKNDKNMLKKAIESSLRTNLNILIYIIDNSPTDELKNACGYKNVEYIFNNKNLGFGAGHNIAMQKMIGKGKYSLILNPDVYFDKDTLDKLFSFMEANDAVGSVMPKVLYPDGSLQYLCRLLPTPLDLFLRKFDGKITGAAANLISKYELKFADYNKQMDVPYLSGCFMFIRTEAINKVGFFDERFFIYFEDIDLSRRIHSLYRTVYYPLVKIYHGYKRGSDNEFALLKYLLSSGISYFNKWGWFFDKERKTINRRTLKKISYA